RKRLLGQTPSDPNGAAWRTIPCGRRAIGRGFTSGRTPSTPELDQLRGHTRKVWPEDRRRRPPWHRQCGRRSIAGSRGKGRRTGNVLRPEIIPHMGRHHANRSRRYKQLLRGHVVDLRRGLKATYQINAQQSFKETVDTGVPWLRDLDALRRVRKSDKSETGVLQLLQPGRHIGVRGHRGGSLSQVYDVGLLV